MKLLVSGYGRGHIGNLFQRNNQNINWKDPDQEEDIAWENINYDPNALTRLQMEQGIMSPNINKDEWDIVVGEENPYTDFVTQAKLNRNEETELGVLKTKKESEDIFGPLTPEQEQRMKDLLQKELEV